MAISRHPVEPEHVVLEVDLLKKVAGTVPLEHAPCLPRPCPLAVTQRIDPWCPIGIDWYRGP